MRKSKGRSQNPNELSLFLRKPERSLFLKNRQLYNCYNKTLGEITEDTDPLSK